MAPINVFQLDSGSFEIEIQPEVGTIGYLWSTEVGGKRYEYFVLTSDYTYPINIDNNQTCQFSDTTAVGNPTSAQDFYDNATSALGTTDVNLACILEQPEPWDPT